MSDNNKSCNVLFLCTGNSARSILAEAILNTPAVSAGRFRAYSAGSYPKGTVNPLALELIESNQLPTQDLRSKSWNEFAAPDAPMMDLVITVCDQAADEVCPIWPGHPIAAHWSIPDPAAVEGDIEKRRHAFLETYALLKQRIELLVSLPPGQIDRLLLHEHVQAVG